MKAETGEVNLVGGSDSVAGQLLAHCPHNPTALIDPKCCHWQACAYAVTKASDEIEKAADEIERLRERDRKSAALLVIAGEVLAAERNKTKVLREVIDDWGIVDHRAALHPERGDR